MFSGNGAIFLVGGMLLLGGFLLRRSARAVARSSRRDVHGEARQQLQRTAMAAESHVERLEVRLQEFDREVESRTATRIAQLQALIVEAREAGARLESVLERCRTGNEALAAEVQPLLEELRLAGFSTAETVEIVRKTAETARSIASEAEAGDSPASGDRGAA